MPQAWTPPIELREIPGGCRLSLGGSVHGFGPTPQEALESLVSKVLDLAIVLYDRGLMVPRAGGALDHRWLEFLWQLGERARQGEDPRRLVLGD